MKLAPTSDRSWKRLTTRYRPPSHSFLLAACMVAESLLSGKLSAEEDVDHLFPDAPSHVETHVIPPPTLDSYLKDEAVEQGVESALEKRFLVLEEKYAELDEKYSDLEANYESLQGELKHVAFTGNSGSTMRISGRIHLDYWAFPGNSPGTNAFETGDPTMTPQDRIGFRRLRFGVVGDLWKTMEYKIEMEFAQGNDVEFRDAYLGWHDLPFLQTLLVGNQKRPYSLDQINSSRYNVFMERPFVAEADDPATRRLGVQSYGFSEDLTYNWRYGVFNLANVQDEGVYIGDHYQGQIAGRLATTCWYDEPSGGRGYCHFAVAGTVADPDGTTTPGQSPNEARFSTRPEAQSSSRWLDTGIIPGADNLQLAGLENVWNFGSLQLVGEYMQSWVDRDGFADVSFPGYYGYVAYFLTGEFMPWDRETGQLARPKPLENFFIVDTPNDGVQAGWGAWQIAYRWSYADYTDEDILGGIGRSHTLGLNWYWNEYSRMQFTALHGEIDDHAPVAGLTSGHYTILGMRFMVDF